MKKETRDTLLIALPTLNEFRNLQALVPQLRGAFPNAFLLFIDDGSKDGTLQFLQHLSLQDSRVEVIDRQRKCGIGSAHLVALRYAIDKGFEYLITMDADLTHRVLDVENLAPYLPTYDLIIGSRHIEQNSIINWPKFRKFLTKSGHLVTRIFFSSNLDMSSGLRGYKVSAIPIQRLELNCTDNYEFFFLSALVYLYEGLHIFQVPIRLLKRDSGNSKMKWTLMFAGILILLVYGLRFRRIK